MPQRLLELEHITKFYPGVTALDDVSLEVGAGEIVGLIGENGAGKSTLMKILGGVVEPSSGTIRLAGHERSALTVAEAIGAGVAFVHQELNLFDNLDVAANVFIGREALRGGPLRLVDEATLHERVTPLLARLGADFRAATPVADLSIAQRQIVEIAKALSFDARIIIMDEPTSSLTLSETDRLIGLLRELRAAGVGIIYISHRLGEVKALADRVVCLRDGRHVGTLTGPEISHGAMIRLMIGRELKALYIPPRAPPGGAACRLDDVVTPAFPERAVSLTIHHGEILGLAGLIGSGRTSLARTLFGIDRLRGGTVRLDGRVLGLRSARDAVANGIYLVPEDRKRSGLVLDMPIVRNVTLANVAAHARFLLIDTASEMAVARAQQASLKIKAPSAESPAATLSGGNQQKVVLAKWLSMKPVLVIFDEPTRGIDVGAKNEIYQLMRDLADRGVAILMISSDMEEVIGVSDRIAVMHDGSISGTLERDQFSEYNVLRLAVGQAPEGEAETV